MIYLILVLLGLCFGSFVNAVVWRIHQQETVKKKQKNLSILNGRSMCPSCKHQLSALDLIPILSWLTLGGKCRYCRKSIPWQYPVVELGLAIVFVVSYIYWPFSLSGLGIVEFAIWLVMLIGFMVIFVYDLRWMIIPDRVILPLIILAMFFVVVLCIDSASLRPALDAIVGVLIASGLFYALFQLSGGKWIGGGDVKLGIVIGLIIGGALPAVLVLFIASLLGTFVSIPLLVSGSGRKKKIPFGPFLVIATVIVFIFGQVLIDWYQTKILLL